MFTTKALRIALFASTFAATWTTAADARPRRVVVLDFDGPRGLADSSRNAVIGALDSYDVVASKKWLEAKSAAGRKKHGPESWSKASKTSGVDAVVEGYIQDEGRAKVLTVIVTDASNGTTFDTLTIRLPAKGFTDDLEDKIKKGIEERFEWIEPINPGPVEQLPELDTKKEKRVVGAKRPTEDDTEEEERPRTRTRTRDRGDDVADSRRLRGRDRDRDRDRDRRDDEEDDGVTEKRVAKIETKQSKAEAKETKETNILTTLFRPVSEEEDIVTGGKASHVPKPTPKFRIGGGFSYTSRSLYIGAENPQNVTQYASVPHKGIGVGGEFFPFPSKKIDGILSGVGFSFNIEKSIGSVVTFDDGEFVGDYSINAYNWHAGVHYRAPLSDSFAIDGELGYGQSAYVIVDAPETFEVPDVAYQYLTAGGSLDLKITDRASVGFGAKYLYTLGTGDLSSTEWYGPGGSSGLSFGGNFVIPLPANLYVRGDITYSRIKTSFDGVGQITEDEGVSEAIDSQIGGNVKVGIQF